MALITISRQLAALGDDSARELAKTLGYRLIDKASLDSALEESGFSKSRYEKFDEKKPGFWASLSRDRDEYIHRLRGAIFREALKGDVVIVGRGAMAILEQVPALISVRLVAPIDIRLERVKSYYHCDDKRARQILERSDSDRAGFHRYFFDIDWYDSSLYLLTLNTGFLHPQSVAKQVKTFCESHINAELEAESREKLSSLVLGQDVVDAILYGAGIPIYFLEANVRNKDVALLGVANSQSQIEAALAVARSVTGIANVINEIQIVQDYSVLP